VVVTTAALSLPCSPSATLTHAGLLFTAPIATRTGASRTAILALLHISRLVLVALWGLVLIAADQAWKNKQYSEWTEADAKEAITGSPCAVAIYGTPRSMMANDLAAQADELKKHATLKRYVKKDLKPSSVEILLREDGPVILYLAALSW